MQERRILDDQRMQLPVDMPHGFERQKLRALSCVFPVFDSFECHHRVLDGLAIRAASCDCDPDWYVDPLTDHRRAHRVNPLYFLAY